MASKRVHIRSTVNASRVSKAGGRYTIRDACGVVDDIVMNGLLYPGDECAAGAASLADKPAPVGHPKNADGKFISATSPEGMLNNYAGAWTRNARHEGGRTLVDIVIDEAQAKAKPDGAKVIERLDAAIAGTNAEPIHVSTGLLLEVEAANGESRGKKYQGIARKLQYDHLAILPNERGAGTPEDGVGLFLNAAGAEEPVDEVALELVAEDRRSRGLGAWLNRLIFRRNAASELSFDQIRDGLWRALQASVGDGAWVREIFDRYAIWTDREGRYWKQDYSLSSDGSVAFSGTAEEVREERSYVPVANQREADPMKDAILAALNKAGIQTNGKTDEQLLADYSALHVAPVQEKLTAANAKIADAEKAQRDAEAAEVAKLSTALAANSKGLTAADFAAMPLARLRELSAPGATAAPVLAGNSGGSGKPAAFELPE